MVLGGGGPYRDFDRLEGPLGGRRQKKKVRREWGKDTGKSEDIEGIQFNGA